MTTERYVQNTPETQQTTDNENVRCVLANQDGAIRDATLHLCQNMISQGKGLSFSFGKKQKYPRFSFVVVLWDRCSSMGFSFRSCTGLVFTLTETLAS